MTARIQSETYPTAPHRPHRLHGLGQNDRRPARRRPPGLELCRCGRRDRGRSRRTIAEIFARHGEAAFREREHATIARLAAERPPGAGPGRRRNRAPGDARTCCSPLRARCSSIWRWSWPPRWPDAAAPSTPGPSLPTRPTWPAATRAACRSTARLTFDRRGRPDARAGGGGDSAGRPAGLIEHAAAFGGLQSRAKRATHNTHVRKEDLQNASTRRKAQHHPAPEPSKRFKRHEFSPPSVPPPSAACSPVRLSGLRRQKTTTSAPWMSHCSDGEGFSYGRNP